MHFFKNYIKKLLLYTRKFGTAPSMFAGDFASWDEAKIWCNGYDSENILDKVKTSLLQVKNGEAVYERDSVLFDSVQYSWPVLAGLLRAACENGNKLSVLDFGGSLGSSYFQNYRFLSHLEELHWNIVEQPSFVECGRRDFEDSNLHFFYSIEECHTWSRCNVILLSSVLPYLERPHELLASILRQGSEYIIIDRTPVFLTGSKDRLTVQKVPETIYDASYPAWFFSRDRLLEHFDGCYEMIAEFDALAGSIWIGSAVAFDKGFIFKKIPPQT